MCMSYQTLRYFGNINQVVKKILSNQLWYKVHVGSTFSCPHTENWATSIWNNWEVFQIRQGNAPVAIFFWQPRLMVAAKKTNLTSEVKEYNYMNYMCTTKNRLDKVICSLSTLIIMVSTVPSHLLITWVFSLGISLRPHNSFHVSRPTIRAGNKSTGWLIQSLWDGSLLNQIFQSVLLQPF